MLIFSGNELSRLGDGAFPARNLDDLQELNLSGCGLRAVSARALRGLANLDRLDLSANALAAVPAAFSLAGRDGGGVDVPRLRELILSGNPITTIEESNRLCFLYLCIFTYQSHESFCECRFFFPPTLALPHL